MVGSKKTGGWRFLLTLINGWVKINGGDQKKFVNIGNEWKKRHKYLILMLNLKVSTQTRSDASMNKAVIKSIKHINNLSKSK